MKYSCDKIKPMLSLYIDDKLSFKKTLHIKRHLENCDDCRHEYELLTALVNEINVLPNYELPPDFEDKLHLALVEASMNIPAKKPFIQRLKPYSAIAAGVILILLIGTGYYDKFRPYDTAYLNDVELSGADNLNSVNKENENSTVNIDNDENNVISKKPNENIIDKGNVTAKENKSDKEESNNNQKSEIIPRFEKTERVTNAVQAPIVEQPPVEKQIPESTSEPVIARSFALFDAPTMTPTPSADRNSGGGGSAVPPAQTEQPSSKSAKIMQEPSSSISATSEVQKFKAYTIISNNSDLLNEVLQKYDGTKEDSATVFYVDNSQLDDILYIAKKYSAEIKIEYETEDLQANKCTIRRQ